MAASLLTIRRGKEAKAALNRLAIRFERVCLFSSDDHSHKLLDMLRDIPERFKSESVGNSNCFAIPT